LEVDLRSRHFVKELDFTPDELRCLIDLASGDPRGARCQRRRPVHDGLSNEFRPTQTLADMLTMKEHIAKPFGEISYCYVSDALIGVEAVIDKDSASELLAEDIGAELFVMATDVDGAYIDWGKPTQHRLDRVTPGSAGTNVVA
jgi:ornithine carbamoyltransferase